MVVVVDFNDLVAYGCYLIYNLACYYCYFGSFDGINEVELIVLVGYFGGGNFILKKDGSVKVFFFNLILYLDYGLGKYSLELFVKAVCIGKWYDGSNFDYLMLLFINLIDVEVNVMYVYL